MVQRLPRHLGRISWTVCWRVWHRGKYICFQCLNAQYNCKFPLFKAMGATNSYLIGRSPHQSLAELPYSPQRGLARRWWIRKGQEHNLRHHVHRQRWLRHWSRPMLRPIQPDTLPRVPLTTHHHRHRIQELQRQDKQKIPAWDWNICLFECDGLQ